MSEELVRRVEDALARLRIAESRVDTVRAMAQRALDLHDDFPDPDPGGAKGNWDGWIRVGVKGWEEADWTGSADYALRIYFDATTPPAYTTEAEYTANPWTSSEYIIVPVWAIRGTTGPYIVPRG